MFKQFDITYQDGWYTAEIVIENHHIISDGQGFDELLQNLQEAIECSLGNDFYNF